MAFAGQSSCIGTNPSPDLPSTLQSLEIQNRILHSRHDLVLVPPLVQSRHRAVLNSGILVQTKEERSAQVSLLVWNNKYLTYNDKLGFRDGETSDQ